MRKANMFRGALAAGMAFSLAAAPVGFAQETELTGNVSRMESEFLSGLEGFDETEFAGGFSGSMDELNSSAIEGSIDLSFGDAFYELAAQNNNGMDLSWLESTYLSFVAVPEKDKLGCEVILLINDNAVCDARIFVDPAGKEICCSIPEFFDQPIVIHAEDLMKNMTGASASTEAADTSSNNALTQMLTGIAAQIGKQIGELAASLPAEVWQQDLMNVMMPVMSSLTQETGTDEITIGLLSAPVSTQTFAIPSDRMGSVISGVLSSLANSTVAEKVLTSDALSETLGVVSMLTGGKASLNGKDLLEAYRTTLEGAAKGDFSMLPGISVTIQTGTQQSAGGIVVEMENGKEKTNLLTCKAISDGYDNCFEIIPGAALLAMAKLDASAPVDIIGQGSTEDGLLNEYVELTVNEETVASLTISDLDLFAASYGELSGTISLEAPGMKLDFVYGVDDYGVRTLDYMVNDELFYHLGYYVGPTEAGPIEAIDVSNAANGDTVEGLQKWLSSFKVREVMDILDAAGVPVYGS
jgi:hypothetical protein